MYAISDSAAYKALADLAAREDRPTYQAVLETLRAAGYKNPEGAVPVFMARAATMAEPDFYRELAIAMAIEAMVVRARLVAIQSAIQGATEAAA